MLEEDEADAENASNEKSGGGFDDISSERVIKEKPNLIMSIKDVPHSGWYNSFSFKNMASIIVKKIFIWKHVILLKYFTIIKCFQIKIIFDNELLWR